MAVAHSDRLLSQVFMFKRFKRSFFLQDKFLLKALAVPELAMETRLASNSRSLLFLSCVCVVFECKACVP